MITIPFINDGAARDAKKIHETIDYRVLRAAWNSYGRILQGKQEKGKAGATPAWFALFQIENVNGNFSKLEVEDLYLLKSLTNVQTVYSEIVKALESEETNQDLSKQIFDSHPDLHEALPSEYNSAEKMSEYLTMTIKTYQRLLNQFYQKHQKNIDETIQRLEKQTS